jgi:hypothetical protein
MIKTDVGSILCLVIISMYLDNVNNNKGGM